MPKNKKKDNINPDPLISPELEEKFKEWELERNILDRVRAIPAGEDYIRLRYPVGFNFSRADLQELAAKNIKRLLTEEEIQQLEDALIDDGKAFNDLCVAIIDAICEVTDKERDEVYKI